MTEDLLYMAVFALLAAVVLIPSVLAARPQLVTRLGRRRRRRPQIHCV